MNNFKALTLSFNYAPVAVREKVVMGEESTKRLLQVFRDVLDVHEALIVSTCNRTEIYYASYEDLNSRVLDCIKVVLGAEVEDCFPYFKKHTNHDEVIKRLFEVSIGLHSLVVGDMQISNQIKKAYQWSVDENMAGPQLHRLLHTVFFTNKRVVQETPFRDGAASVSYAAKELAERLAGQIVEATILVVGLGEIGRDFCDNIAGTGHKVVVSNRTASIANKMAAEYGFETVPFTEIRNFALKSADIIVSSVSVEKPLFNTKDFPGTKIFKPKYFLDLGVPRNVDPKLQDNEAFIIYTIDELESKADESLKKRMESFDKVKSIIAEEIVSYSDWSRDMVVSPTIKKLKSALEQIRTEEIERYLKNATEKETKLVDKVTKSMMQKIIKLPVLQLKDACKRGDAETLIDVLNDLFNLEKEFELKDLDN